MLFRVCRLRFCRKPRKPIVPPTNRLLAVAEIMVRDRKTGFKFVINEWRILDDGQRLHVAVPTRPRRIRCGKCYQRTTSGFQFCARCGCELHYSEFTPEGHRRQHHEQVFIPQCPESFFAIQKLVLEKYLVAVERRKARRAEREKAVVA